MARLHQARRALVAACIGNLLEWYDFTVYALFAPYIAATFFPRQDPGTALVSAFMTFGAGFVVRPLGAVIIGGVGDRSGRKAALTLSIAMMGAGTLLIAAVPGPDLLGPAAAWLLLSGRLLQGFSAGGEIGTASALLAESAGSGERGAMTAWQEGAMGLSNILGALVAFVLSSLLSRTQIQAWGWRVPFLLGLLIVPAGLYLRRSLEETADFRQQQRNPQSPARAPLREAFGAHGAALAVGLGISVPWAVAVYVLNIYTPVYVQKAFGFSAQQAFLASLVGNVLFVASGLLAGRWSDRIGRRSMLLIGAAGLLGGVLPLYLWLQSEPVTLVLLLAQCGFCTLVGAFAGVAPAALADLFPTAIRATGIALVYNAAFVVFGGLALPILTWFTRQANGSALAPAWYVMSASLVGLLSLPFFEARRAAAASAATAAAT